MSTRASRAGWRPWAGREPLDKIDAAPAQIARAITETIASRTLDTHLTSAIAEFAPKENVMSDTDQAAATPTVIVPPAPATAAQAPAASPTPSSPGAHALTIKQVLEEHGRKLDQVLQAQLALLVSELDGQLGTVVTGTEAVISHVRGRTDDFKAILGQYVNDIG